MAKQDIVIVECDRCHRQEMIPKSEERTGEQPAFKARLFDEDLQYQDLCPRCAQAMKNYWSDFKQWDREIKPIFGPSLEGERAPPMEVAPDYSPPKPHSLAGSKR